MPSLSPVVHIIGHCGAGFSWESIVATVVSGSGRALLAFILRLSPIVYGPVQSQIFCFGYVGCSSPPIRSPNDMALIKFLDEAKGPLRIDLRLPASIYIPVSVRPQVGTKGTISAPFGLKKPPTSACTR